MKCGMQILNYQCPSDCLSVAKLNSFFLCDLRVFLWLDIFSIWPNGIIRLKGATMPAMPARGSFFGLPALGGWLSVTNACLWLLLYFSLGFGVPVLFFGFILPLAICVSLPTFCLTMPAFFFLKGLLYPHSDEVEMWEAMVLFVLMAINSFCWGYLLASILRRGRENIACIARHL